MDIAEMKPASRAKATAKPNADVAKGNALAHLVVEWAWKEAEAEEKRGTKLALFVQSIGELAPEAHTTFRAALSQELAALAELDKASGMGESRKAGYSLASFRVMVSNLRAISEAVQLGMKTKDKAGNPVAWSVAIEKAREVRKARVATGEAKGGQGKAGRKPLTDFDKAMRLVSKLNLRDLRKVNAATAALIEAAETGKRPKVAANQANATAAA